MQYVATQTAYAAAAAVAPSHSIDKRYFLCWQIWPCSGRGGVHVSEKIMLTTA